MTHLVRPLHKPLDETSLARCTELLHDARDYLAKRGRVALAGLNDGPDLATWGRRMKRVKVELNGARPLLVTASGWHNLGEVINQCATLERLIDALVWAQSQPDLRDLRIVRCHPTTSSDRDPDDNDLVLADGDGNIRACFEVSDVSGKADGNGKEQKDLVSLGLLPDAHGQIRPRASGCRRYLVVSHSFARHLTGRRRKVPFPFAYKIVHPAGNVDDRDLLTAIVEVTALAQVVSATKPASQIGARLR